MSRYWSAVVHGLTPYVPGEQPKLDNLVKLNTNEHPYGPSPKALEAIRAATGDSLRLYPDPNADALKKGQWTQDLLTQAVTIGHGLRMRVGMAWIGTTLRLEAKEKRMELQPGAEGIDAVFFVDGVETGREAADLAGDPGALARRWLGA